MNEGNGNSNTPVPLYSCRSSRLYFDISNDKCPIIYSPDYNITFYGLQKLHPFDVTKWGRAHKKLIRDGLFNPGQSVVPHEAIEEDLLLIHTPKYLNSLKSSTEIAYISEFCLLFCLPSSVLNSKLLKPLRYQTGGSVLGTKLAKERGWSINLGGGFHHCSSNRGGGFCFYADISLCVKFLLEMNPSERIMIIDLDAHQGNGHERDWGTRNEVFILDAYNRSIYPQDSFARRLINCQIPLDSFTDDASYMQAIESNIKESIEKFSPTFVIYNAGTDVMENDRLGRLSITPEGIVQRDMLVFCECRKRGIPILMLTSGGYQYSTPEVIANSIKNLVQNSVISLF